MSRFIRDRHIDLLNDQVNPPILTRGIPTRKTGQYSRNIYMDTDNPDEAFYEEDLTGKEKGHIYLYKVLDSGSVLLFSPHRIFDKGKCKTELNGKLCGKTDCTHRPCWTPRWTNCWTHPVCCAKWIPLDTAIAGNNILESSGMPHHRNIRTSELD